MSEEEILQRVAERLAQERMGAVFSGAGISTESGIPDFRSAGGLWERFDPMKYATLDAFIGDPHKVWIMLREMDSMTAQAQPNPAHFAVAELESLGVIEGVVTQNVDGLHQRAGSRRVIEFHGSASMLRCLECGQREEASSARARFAEEFPPRCRACGRVLKPEVIFFGEGIDPEVSQEAMKLAARCRTMLVVGTSGLVAPASYVPVLAAKMGAWVVEINLSTTVLTGTVASFSLFAPASRTLPRLVELVRARLAV